MKYFFKLVFFIFFISASFFNPSFAIDLQAGKEKAEGVCAGCHGKDGITAILPSYPILAGQHKDYLSQALSDYKSGARQNAFMSGIASTLTNDDISNISAYFSTMPGPLHLKLRQ
jgi:cytochrome c553